MTRCRDVERLATAYVDGELDDRRSSAVRGHLRMCSRCAERVEDEARVRALAADLAPIDPPQLLWQAIDARLAEAEIGDSRRSRLWLLFQAGREGVRQSGLLLAAAAAAGAVLLILWLPNRGGERRAEIGGAASRAAGAGDAIAAPQPGTEASAMPATTTCDAALRTHDEQVLCQIREADRRYLDAIAELTRAAAEERPRWSAADASRFDRALAELAELAEVERVRLAGQPVVHPAGRDPLHAIYRAQIDLLSAAVIAGDLGAGATGRGAP